MPDFRRRDLLVLIATIALVITALPWHAAPTRAQDESPIIIGTTDLPTTLDTGEAYDLAAWEVLGHLYTGLTRQVPGTLDYELALATDVSISDDRLTYTFTLPGDAAFTDGTPITAQTFVDSIARVLDFRRFQGQNRQAAEAIDPYVAAVEAPDDTTLVFTLERPVPFFLGLVSLPPYFPVHPDAQTEQPTPFPESLIGNGPYLLEEYRVGETLVLTPNPAYNGTSQPANAGIVLRQYARTSDLREALRDGAIDVAWRTMHLYDVIDLMDEGFQVVETASTRTFYMNMNQDRAPFDDPLVREAVTLLIDRTSAIEAIFKGHAIALTSLIPELYGAAYNPIWPNDPDVELVEDILREASYSARGQSRLGFSIAFSRPTYGDLYVAAVNEIDRSFNATLFVETGVNSNIETNTLISALRRGEGIATIFGWTPIVPHPAAYLRPLAHSEEPIPANSEYATAQIDEWLDAAAIATDPDEQAQLYRLVQQALFNEYAIIPLWQDMVQVVAQPDITGITLSPNPILNFTLLARES